MATKAAQKLDLDLVAEALASDQTGVGIVQALSVKGFCVVKPPVDQDHMKGVQADIMSIDAAGRLLQPPEPILEGLLGIAGSARTAELQLPTDDAEKPDGEHLWYFDNLMTDYGAMIKPYLPSVAEVVVQKRTAAVLHEAGMPPGEGPELDEQTCANWLHVFAHHKVMLVWCLGPDEGTLELQPFDDESNGHRVTMKPGTMVMLRPDALSHRFSSTAKAYCLTCFYQKDGYLCKYKDTSNMEMTPCCRALEEWAVEKIQEYKESLAEEQTRIHLPRHWELVMNHTSFVGQHISLRTCSIKQPSTYNPAAWSSAFTTGPDYAQEVPMLRWNIENHYHPHPESWEYGRTNCKHGSFFEGAELFDNALFRISKVEAGGMDPGHRLTLECGYEALVRDGYKVSTIMNTRGGVYVANPPPSEWGMAEKTSTFGGVCGGGGSIACGRFSFVHGMKGPCISVDVEAASSLVAINFCSTNLSRTGKWEAIPFGICNSWQLSLSPIFSVHMSAARRLNPAGRTFSFDASADGFIRGEVAVSVCLKALTSIVDDELKCNYSGAWLGAIAATATNQSGRRSSMISPDATAMQECMYECLRTAEISPLDVDAVETCVDGNVLFDALEASATAKAYRPEGMPGLDETCTIGLLSGKTNWGNQIEANGLSTVIKVCCGAHWGAMNPCLHLRILNPHMDIEACERPAHFCTEMLEYRLSSTFTGVTNRSIAGTNVHALCWGQISKEHCSPIPQKDPQREKILFWPEGGGQLEDDQIAKRGYSLMGTFNGWQQEPMESEGAGIFGCTFTLGENRWERFQIAMDHDARKVLYPGDERLGESTVGAPVAGPNHVFRNSSWLVDTRPYLAYTDDLAALGDTGLAPYQGAAGQQDRGRPGDRFRVRLSVKGKWRMVEWENLDKTKPASEAVDLPRGSYQIAGSWSHGVMEEMYPVPDVPGLFAAEVTLLSHNVNMFQIFRNRDWEQAIYPDEPFGSMESGILGPEEQIGHAWVIDGKPGQVWRVELSSSLEDGFEKKKVEWKFDRAVELSTVQWEMSKLPEFYVMGSWDGYGALHRMHFAGSYWQFFVQLGAGALESFQVYQDGNPRRCIYPGLRDANPFEPHDVLGPDAKSAGLVWTIGANESDEAEAGKRYEVKLWVNPDLSPAKLDWSSVTAIEGLEDARGRGYLILGP